MKPKLADLGRWEGEVSRGVYLVWGLVLFAIKYNLDRAIAWWGFHRDWSLFNYVLPGRVFQLSAMEDVTFCLTMLAVALPFVWLGVALTLRRLRSVGWPLWLVALFFVPLVSFLFFAVLSVVPAQGAREEQETDGGWLARVIPDSKLGSAAVGMAMTVGMGLGVMALSVNVFHDYGLGLFVLVPFCCGLVAVLVHGFHQPRSMGECVLGAVIAVTLLGVCLMAFALEGAICILMAAPLALPLAILGGVVGHAIQGCGRGRREVPPVIGAMSLALPLLLGVEHAGQPRSPLLEVRSVVEIAAAPERVWPQVVAFAELPAPTEWLFRSGVAYPQRAEIAGQGVGAIRYCVFSTGAFEEPIEVWDEPRLLRFGVTKNPPPMEEWTPYTHVHPPHLDGFLMSERGQFRLEALPGGRTRLEGTTWYRHNLWPAKYWQVWSDYIIHRIHLRVLEYIKERAE